MAKTEALKAGKQTLAVSNLDKIFYPANGFTKGNVIEYYIKAAPFILPHLKNRPYTLKRYPEGITGSHFYEKNAPSYTPRWVKTSAVERKHGGEPIRYVLVNDLETLVWVANLASIEMHVLLATAPRIDRPRFLVFDLDPGPPAGVLDCAEVAFWLKELLDKFELKSFIKFSGSKGLQMYVPLNVPVTYEVTQAFAKALAELLEREHPERVVSEMAKEKRSGKVFIDWSQNSEFKTTVSVYSMRAKRDIPFISIPLDWAEVRAACSKGDARKFDFTPPEALKRMAKKGDIFAPVLELKQKIPRQFARVIKPASESAPEAVPENRNGSLSAYNAKRNFAQTQEPRPIVKSKADGQKRLFVIQKHRASHLHYDFRLEMNGVLKSWAVPKGPPYTRAEKRLAMEVEDHPMDYARFEGTIPPGNYGAGTVMVWDIGEYQVLDGNIHQGKLHLLLNGKKLKGEWILVRAKRDEAKQPWFLIKGGESMPPLGPKKDDASVLTGRSMEKITHDNDAQWASNR